MFVRARCGSLRGSMGGRDERRRERARRWAIVLLGSQVSKGIHQIALQPQLVSHFLPIRALLRVSVGSSIAAGGVRSQPRRLTVKRSTN